MILSWPPLLTQRNKLFVSVAALLLPATLCAESVLDDAEFFAKIAETGFAYHVQGSIFKNPTQKTGFPNLIQDQFYDPIADPQLSGPGPRNSYPWSMAWFGGKLYVGTNRNLHCTEAYNRGGDPDCPAAEEGYVVGLPDSLWRAEIWAFTPSLLTDSGDYGLSGTWERVYQSPPVDTIFTTRLQSLLTFLENTFGYDTSGMSALPTDTPRDGGYRMMTACGTGTSERLYITTYGIPGNILAMNSAGTITQVPMTGTYSDVNCQLAQPNTWENCQNIYNWSTDNSILDFGYRALDCFEGALWTSPAGTLDDADIAYHPVVLRNANPSSTSSSWTEVVDTRDWDANNLGIFQMNHVGRYLFLSVINRTTGWQLWRGTVEGAGCSASNPCWENIIEQGAGRPIRDDGTIENAGATLGVYEYSVDGITKYDLYMGAGESGYSEEGLTSAELLVIRDAGSGNKNWELLVGWPRADWQEIKNMTCSPVKEIDIPTTFTHPLDATVTYTLTSTVPHLFVDNDSSKKDCLPTSNYGPGMAILPSTPTWPNNTTDGPPFPYPCTNNCNSATRNAGGRENYFWRMATHDGSFFIGTLGRSSMWRIDYKDCPDTSEVETVCFDRVFTGGLDDPQNGGIRTLASTSMGLGVGFVNANFDAVDSEGKRTGGLEIYLGADLFNKNDVTRPPLAIAEVVTNIDSDENGSTNHSDRNADGIIDVFDITGDKQVTVTLTGEDSHSLFGGPAISSWEWFSGDKTATCATATGAMSCPDAADEDCTLTVASISAGADYVTYTFTLRVSDGTKKSCDTVAFTASSNLPPLATVIPSIPFEGTGFSPYRVNLIDFDGDTFESYNVMGYCNDPVNEYIASCKLVAMDGGSSLTNVKKTCNALGCQTTATVTVLRTDLADNLYDTSSPDIYLEAQDDVGYTTRFSFDTRVASAEPDSSATNFAPTCRNHVLETEYGTPLVLDPTLALDDGNPLCLDRDGDIMIYEVRTPASNYGPANGTVLTDNAVSPPVITYTPDYGFSGADEFRLRANDGQRSGDYWTIAKITVKPLAPTVCQWGKLEIANTVFGSGDYYRVSDQEIFTSGQVQVLTGSDVTFNGPRVRLLPGFSVQPGGVFKTGKLIQCPLSAMWQGVR